MARKGGAGGAQLATGYISLSVRYASAMSQISKDFDFVKKNSETAGKAISGNLAKGASEAKAKVSELATQYKAARVASEAAASSLAKLNTQQKAAAGASGKHSKAVHLIRGDAEFIPFADGSVQAVTGILVIHLVEDPVPVLRECRRVLVPGGKLALITQSDDFGPGSAGQLDQPIEEVEQAFLEGCLGSAESNPRHGKEEWERMFHEAGWSPPTITIAVPGVAWLLFAQTTGTEEEEEQGWVPSLA